MEKMKIIQKGDKSGNGMTVRFRLPSGLEIFSLPTKNFYGGEWDLGPTWNYAVMADEPFLVDSGRYGQGKHLVGMMKDVGIKPGDLHFVLISHGHEDHDGGLAELVQSTRLRVRAHAVYNRLIRKYPESAPPGYKKEFPAKCWHCFMPESFYSEHCLQYHRVLQDLKVDPLGDGESVLGNGVTACHLPGHSPDCLAVFLGEEAVLVGDILLPDITPWPTREVMFEEVRSVLSPDYTEPHALFGLRRYIKSLKALAEKARLLPDLLVLPAHRLYFNGQWKSILLEERINELLRHHIERCGAILDILSSGPKTAGQITEAYFDPGLLAGFGYNMAVNEVVSHCELLIHTGDMVMGEDGVYEATGSSQFTREIKR